MTIASGADNMGFTRLVSWPKHLCKSQSLFCFRRADRHMVLYCVVVGCSLCDRDTSPKRCADRPASRAHRACLTGLFTLGAGALIMQLVR